MYNLTLSQNGQCGPFNQVEPFEKPWFLTMRLNQYLIETFFKVMEMLEDKKRKL
jgi:hypothetical protein